jgi:hypothetical protein
MKQRYLHLKNKSGIALAIAALISVPATSQASLQIKIDDGINTPILVIDNLTGDLSSALGVNTLVQALGSWTVNITSAANLGSTATSPLLSLTSFNVSYTGTGSAPTTPLKVFLTDTGYGPTPGLFNLNIGGTQTGNATITSNFYYDTTNTAFGLSNQIGTTQNFTSTSYSNSQLSAGPGSTLLSPYSLTIEADISNVPSGLFSTQFTSTLTAVPIPGAIWLFGTGLLGIITGRRNNNSMMHIYS